MPFPVQRVQTDRGQEFFAHEVQDQLREQKIKFRPDRPRAPHLNGKVERVQRTAPEEFWPTVDPKRPFQKCGSMALMGGEGRQPSLGGWATCFVGSARRTASTSGA